MPLRIALLIFFLVPLSHADKCESTYEIAGGKVSIQVPPKIAAFRSEAQFDRAVRESNPQSHELEADAKAERFAFAKDAVARQQKAKGSNAAGKDWDLKDEWKDAIWKAHRTTAGQTGKVTLAQLLAKTRILKDAQVPDHIIEALFKEGVCGPAEDAYFREFIAAGKDEVEKDERRLVFADFLDGNGDHVRADLIRTQMALRHSAINPAEFTPPELKKLKESEESLQARLLENAEARIHAPFEEKDLQRVANWLEENGDKKRADYLRSRLRPESQGPTPEEVETFLRKIPEARARAAWGFFEFDRGIANEQLRSAVDRIIGMAEAEIISRPGAPQLRRGYSNEERLKYVAWLNQNGAFTHARLLTLTAELGSLPKDDPRIAAVTANIAVYKNRIRTALNVMMGPHVTCVFDRGLVGEVRLPLPEPVQLKMLIKSFPGLRRIIDDYDADYKKADEDKVKASIAKQPPEQRSFVIAPNRSVTIPDPPKPGFFGKSSPHLEFLKGRQAVTVITRTQDLQSGYLIGGVYNAQGNLVFRFPAGRALGEIEPHELAKFPPGKYEIRLE